MSITSVYAIVESQSQAESIVSSLKEHSFSNDQISVLFPDKSTTSDFAHEKNTKAPEGAVTGGVTGGLMGGALGWIAGIGALAIPGVGPFIAAGPLAAAIGGVALGASLGGIAGGLVGLGIPEIEAKRYEGKIKEGNILISVQTENSDEINRVKEILEDHEADDICTAKMKETSTSKDKKGNQHDDRHDTTYDSHPPHESAQRNDHRSNPDGHTRAPGVAPAGTVR